MNKIRPFLKWAGSKYSCLDKLKEVFPSTDRYIEPFTGSGAVFINFDYTTSILAEQNNDLICLFKYLQKEGVGFIDYCERWFVEQTNNSTAYYVMREEFNQLSYSRKRAALFLYLNRHGYNGLCRYNQSGVYNVPFGSYLKPYFPRKEMLFFYDRAQKAKFIQADFRETFTYANEGDLIYCDPPYAPLQQASNFTGYTSSIFGLDEQICLADLAKDAARKGVTVIISNHDTDFIREQYQSAKLYSFAVKRVISCKADHRSSVRELLAVFAP